MAELSLILVLAIASKPAPPQPLNPQSFILANGIKMSHRVGELIGPGPSPNFAASGRQIMLGIVSNLREPMSADRQIAAGLYHLIHKTIRDRKLSIDPRSRWLIDGLADFTTATLLHEYLGKEAAHRYTTDRDPRAFGDIQKRLNLGYWMGSSRDVILPYDSERRLHAARIAFALTEVRNLILDHDPLVIRAIFDAATNQPLLDAVVQITGQDLKDRLPRYQSFSSAPKALAHHLQALNEARRAGEADQAVIHAKRVMEWRRRYNLKEYMLIALLLHEAGKTDAALATIQQRIRTATNDADRLTYLLLLVEYAMLWEQPAMAYQAAELALDIEPDSPIALVVSMHHQHEIGKLIQAKVTAERIVALAASANAAHVQAAKEMIDRVELTISFPE